jgi:hypothetical protein
VDDAGPVVTGLVGIGDSVTHTNPTLGQGVALTLLAAQRVAVSLDQPVDPRDFTRDYYDWAVRTLKPWFDHQVKVDSGDQVLFARKSGEPAAAPPSFDDATRAQFAATPCAMEDPVVMRARAQVRHLAVTPDVAFRVEEVREHLGRWLQRNPGFPAMPEFVSRHDWDQLTGMVATADA